MERKLLSNLLAIASVAGATLASFGSSFVYAQTMKIEINGLRSFEGVVHVLVYDNAEAFAETTLTDLANYATHAATSDPLLINLNGMMPGTYAIAIHHDENANEKFEKDGELPLEGWGYSNNVGQSGVPSFDAATFNFNKEKPLQKVKVVYAN